MTLPVLVLRPEPGASATARRVEASGLIVRKHPLFAAAPIGWKLPTPAPGTRLLLTSANAARHGGPQLRALSHLPCWCVGPATAEAAHTAGLAVAHAGNGDAAALVAALGNDGPILWLCGVQRNEPVWPDGLCVETIAVYSMDEQPVREEALRGPAIALLHSARAATRLATLAGTARSDIDVVAISPAVARAAGDGWHSLAAADDPADAAMIDLALRLQASHGPVPSKT